MNQDLEKITQLTEQLLKLFQEGSSTKKRDQLIAQMNQLIEQRESYIQRLNPPYSAEEIEKGQHIVEMNKRLAKKMLSFQNELKKEMQQMKKSKQSTEGYVNPYKDVRSIDGMFLDQKK